MSGDGPVVVALHESPRSSLSLLPLIETLADRYRVVALDTPGYGLSDALPGDAPTMDEFVAALGGFLDTMGFGQIALYGAHTGAALATAFARTHPHRVNALVLDGLSAFTDAEVEAFRTRYLTPYAPDWDGAHVMRLWSRVKDLFTWFPWYDQSPVARLHYEPASVEALHLSALGFLQAGRHYTKAYIRAAAFQPNTVLRDILAPTTVMARPDDLIADHLDRLDRGPGWEVAWLEAGREGWSAAVTKALSRGAEPSDEISAPVSANGSRFVKVGQGWTHVCLAGPANGPVRLVLPGLPGDLNGLVARESASHPRARIVGLSPPGCGWSDPLASAPTGLDPIINVLDLVLEALALEPIAMTAEGASVLIARLWVAQRSWRFAIEMLDPPAWLDHPELLPTRPLLESATPRWDGTHLTGAWFQLRDCALYDVPPGTGDPVRRAQPATGDVDSLDRRFISFVQGPECAAILELLTVHVRTRARTASGALKLK